MKIKLFPTTFLFLSVLTITLLSSLSHAQTRGPILCDEKNCSKEKIQELPQEIIVTGTRIPSQEFEGNQWSVAIEEEDTEESKDDVIKGSKIFEN